MFYGDESGFSLTPYIPYGWQPVNQPIRVKTEKSKRLNLFGLMGSDNTLEAYSFWGSANASLIISFIDDFVGQIKQRSAIILDNASVHKTKEFKAKIKEWQEKDLYIFFLPTYSPHLNIIEILWRKMKYEWLQPKDYENLQTLEAAIDNIVIRFGKDFTINFNA